jgi:hypothetical protein
LSRSIVGAVEPAQCGVAKAKPHAIRMNLDQIIAFYRYEFCHVALSDSRPDRYWRTSGASFFMIGREAAGPIKALK